MPEDLKKAKASASKVDEGAKAAEEKAKAEAEAKERAAADAEAAANRKLFCGVLESRGVESSMSWEEAMRLIISDENYKSLKTLGERKACFHEWRQARLDEADEAERMRLRGVKVDFLQMLKETAELTSRTRFSKVIGLFESDARWLALDDDEEREELYEEYALSLERKEAAERKGLRKERMADFKQLLRSAEAGVTVRTQWRRLQDRLGGEAAFRNLEKIDRLAVFEEVIRELEAEEDHAKAAEREVARRADRVKRDAFRALLLRKVSDGALSPLSRWRDVVDELRPTPEYRFAREQSGSTPAELFEDVIESLNDEYAPHRKRLRSLLAEASDASPPLAISLATTADELAASLAPLDADGLRAMPKYALPTFLAEQHERLRRDLADEERRREHRARVEREDAERHRRLTREAWVAHVRAVLGERLGSSSWEEACAALGAEGAPPMPAMAAEFDEAERQAAFEDLLSRAGHRSGGRHHEDEEGRGSRSKRKKDRHEREGSDDEEGGRKEKRKKKRRHHHHEHDEHAGEGKREGGGAEEAKGESGAAGEEAGVAGGPGVAGGEAAA